MFERQVLGLAALVHFLMVLNPLPELDDRTFFSSLDADVFRATHMPSFRVLLEKICLTGKKGAFASQICPFHANLYLHVSSSNQCSSRQVQQEARP